MARSERKQSKNNNNANVNNRHKQTDRTTKLLIVILILFLVAEFPLVNIYFIPCCQGLLRWIFVYSSYTKVGNCNVLKCHLNVQGILGMLSAILGTEFFDSCYVPLAEILEIIVLINSATNFILYCLMSSQFRSTGRKLLRLRGKSVSGTFRRMSSIKLEVFRTIDHRP